MFRNLARQISHDLHSDCFAMILTAGFYCDSRTHNVRKVRVVKYGMHYMLAHHIVVEHKLIEHCAQRFVSNTHFSRLLLFCTY